MTIGYGFPTGEARTWIPTLGGTSTYTYQRGIYLRAHDIVHFSGRIAVALIGTGSTTTISGLPFVSTDIEQVISVGFDATLSVGVVSIEGVILPNSASIIMLSRTVAATSATAISVFGNSTTIAVSGYYFLRWD